MLPIFGSINKIWIEVGTSNTHRYVSIHQIHPAIIIIRLTERVKWGHWNYYKTATRQCEIPTKEWRANNFLRKTVCHSSIQPTCLRVLLQKIKRTHLVARRWLFSTQGTQSTISCSARIWMEIRRWSLSFALLRRWNLSNIVICNEANYTQEAHEEDNNELYDY